MMKDLSERKLVYLDDAIDAIVGCTNCGTEDELRAYVTRHSLEDVWSGGIVDALDAIEQLPPAQPEIIRCQNCKFASGDSRICMKFGHSPIGELDFCAWAERRTDE